MVKGTCCLLFYENTFNLLYIKYKEDIATTISSATLLTLSFQQMLYQYYNIISNTCQILLQ